MKLWTIISLALAVFVTTFTSCKKNEKDDGYTREYWVGMGGGNYTFYSMQVTTDGTWFVGHRGGIFRTKLKPHPEYYFINEKSHYYLEDQRLETSEMIEGPGSSLYFVRDINKRCCLSEVLRTDSSLKTFADVGFFIFSKFPMHGTSDYHQFRCLASDRKGTVYFSLYTEPGPVQTDLQAYLVSTPDNGQTFNYYTCPAMRSNPIMKLRSDTDGYVYALLRDGKLYGSARPYSNWTEVSINNQVIDASPGDKGQLLVTTENGVYQSPDYGKTLAALSLPARMKTNRFEKVFVSPRGSLYGMCDSNNIERADSLSNCYFSTDKGKSWKNVPSPSQSNYLNLQGFTPTGRLMAFYTEREPLFPNTRYSYYVISFNPAE